MASTNEISSSAITLATTKALTATITKTALTTDVPTSYVISTGIKSPSPGNIQNGLNDGQKAGIAVGVIVFVSIIVAIIVFITIRRRKQGQNLLRDGEPQGEGNKEHAENRQNRAENKYVKKSVPKVDTQEVVYENPAADQQNYYNVHDENSDSAVHADETKGSRKPAIVKQDSLPTIYAPPPPSIEESRTSMPVEIAPNCPVIDEAECDEDEYIIPEDPSKITVPKRPPYTGRKPENNDGELYLDMSSAPGEELYIDPDSGQDQKSYMNFDAKSKTVEDEERKGGPKDYVNLSKQEKGAAFGVHPKEINATPRREATTPVTTSDAESYQNVFYENKAKQNKKPQRKK